MASKLQVGIIGLGNFGMRFGINLMELGHQVVGVDRNPDKIKAARNELTQTYQADATDAQALAQMGFGDLTHVLVSLGKSIEASAMISMYLKELKIPNLWVKAVSRDHEKLLLKLGVDKVIMPDHYAARQLANRMVTPGFIDYLPFGGNMALIEIKVDTWAGKTLREIDMTNKYHVQVIAIKRAHEIQFGFIPKADDPLQKGDILALMGSVNQLSEIKP